MSVVITCYSVAPSATPPAQPVQPATGGPGRPADQPAVQPAARPAVYRAVNEDARFGYITVDPSGAEPPAPAGTLTGRYEVVHEGATTAPPFGGAVGAPLIFVNCMEFPPGREEVAFDFWLRVNEYMVRKPGYRWHRLHRRVEAGAPFGQINVVEWESIEAWDAAHDDGFFALTRRPDIPFVAVPTLCRALTLPVEA